MMKKEEKLRSAVLSTESTEFVWKTGKGLISMQDMDDDYLVKAFQKCQHRELRARKAINKTFNTINKLKKKLEIEKANLSRSLLLQEQLQQTATNRQFIIQDIENENFKLLKEV